MNLESSNRRLMKCSAHPLRAIRRIITWTVVIGACLLQTQASWWTARAQVTGLIAAYGFDEGVGTVVTDSSGSGNTGTVTGATWTTAGKFGGALSFNGTNARVTIPDSASLDLTDAMTLEAWVYPTVAPSGWRSVVAKDVDRYYLMAGSDNQNRPAVGGTFGAANQNVFGTGTLPVNTWTHVAVTYDRATIRLYVNGVQIASGAQTAAVSTSNAVLTIGADFYGEYFTGLIDEVRIYNRALTGGEVQTDSGTPLSAGPRLVINQPAAGSTVANTTINVAYSTTGDLTGVNHVHFKLDSNPEVMDLSFDGVYQFTGVPAGAHTLSGYLVHADHSAFPNSNTSVNFTTTVPDLVPPTVSIASPAGGATVAGVISVSANAADDVGVVGVQFRLDGTNVGTEDLTAPYAIAVNTATFANGPHTASAVARDLGGNSTVSPAVSFTIANTIPNDPAHVGQWSAPFSWPIVGLHAALLPTGKVLTWADHSDGGGVQLWNPATGTFTSKPYAAANLFCAGQTLLADGRLLVIGGHVANYVGLRNTTIFDSWSESWVPAGNMTYGRWYPTATMLGDGRVLAVSGAINCPTCDIPNDPHNGLADIAEIYNPATNVWSPLASAPRRFPMYPHMFLLQDGRVFASSANEDPVASAVLNIGTQQWTQIGGVMDGGSAAMYAPGKIIKSGSAWNPDYPVNTAIANTYVIDMNVPSPAWRQTPSMAFARTEHTLTLLPDGSVLATGGSGDSNVFNLGPAVYEAELWSPTTETWTTMARMDVPRHYHSTAMLLPDARVLIEGSGTYGIDQLSGQIYSPPYLFKGARPVITSAPASGGYGSTLTVQTPDAARIGSVTAAALASVTHAFNTNQRIVPLSFQSGAGSLNVTLPTNVNLMPPGYYLLFLVDTNGVPSVSTMLKVTPVSDTSPPTAPSSLVATANSNQMTLSWTAATDNVGVTGYRVERCQSAGCSTFAEIATTTTSPTYLDTGLAATTSYSYRVRATDAAGLLGPYSNIATATTGSGPAPTVLVAAYAFNEGSGSTVSDASSNAITGTITGASWTTAGKYGGALSFNGTTSYVDLGNPAALQLTGSMTIEAWVKAAADPADDGQIVAKSNGTGWQFKTSPDTGAHTFGLGVSGSAGTIAQRYSTTVRSLNTWYHFAAVYDVLARTLTTYVNGVLDNGTLSGTIPASQVNQAVNVNIGRRPDGAFYFNGLIDEVRIYSGTLTPAQIQADMNTSIGTPPPPDTIPPTVSMTAPAPGATVSAMVSLSASASDNGTLAGVQFLLDGANLGPEVAGAGPTYTYSWNTATATNGAHTVSARARDAANNTATAANITVAVSNTPPSGAVTAAYSFNAGSGTTAVDSSGNGITGTLSGATWTTAGKYGNALSFNGTSSYVNLGNPTALAGTGSMTWAAWVNATGTPADDGQIIAKSNNASGWQFKTSPDTGPHTFALSLSGSTGFVQRYSTTVRALNTWYHVAGVYNAATLTLDIYVNGVLNNGVLSGTVPASQTVPNINVNIGRRTNGYYFKGVIDEVRVYNRALSQTEIQALMGAPLP